MPTIDTPLLIDLLLGLVILLFVPFGIRRGAAKEAMVSAGLLFGALVATTWADRGGAELAAWTPVEAEMAPFVVAMAALFGGVVLLGYGGGAALGHVSQGWLSHLVGGVLAILNSGLLLTYLLMFMEEYLQPPRALDDGLVAEALLQRFDLFQLAAGGGLILLVILGVLISVVRQQSQPRPVAVAPRQRPVRVARDGDTGKYEPGPVATVGPASHQAALDQTAPILDRPRRPWDEPAPAGNGAYQTWTAQPATNGQTGQSDESELWERRTSAASWSAGGGAPVGGQAGYGYGGVSDAGSTRCPSCGAAVGARDLFCPSCGKTV